PSARSRVVARTPPSSVSRPYNQPGQPELPAHHTTTTWVSKLTPSAVPRLKHPVRADTGRGASATGPPTRPGGLSSTAPVRRPIVLETRHLPTRVRSFMQQPGRRTRGLRYPG